MHVRVLTVHKRSYLFAAITDSSMVDITSGSTQSCVKSTDAGITRCRVEAMRGIVSVLPDSMTRQA